MMQRFLLAIALSACSIANGQSMPIMALTDVVFPAQDPALSEFEWVDTDGTLTRSGDLNGDGIDDLLVLFNGQGVFRIPETRVLWLYTRDQDGSFNQPEYLSGFDLQLYGTIQDFAVHDHDRDGRDDILLLTDAGRYLHVWLNTDAGLAHGPVLDLGAPSDVPQFGRLKVGDFSGNGLDDYLVWNNAGAFHLWLAQASGDFVSRLLYDQFSNISPGTRLLSADADRDGDPDIIMWEQPGSMQWFENIGISFVPRQSWEPEITGSHTSFDFAVFGDFNGDGLDDIMFPAQRASAEGFGFYLAPFDLTEPREVPFVELPAAFESSEVNLPSYVDWEEPVQSPGDLDGDGTDDVVFFPGFRQRRGWVFTDPMNLNGRSTVSRSLDLHGTGTFDEALYNYDERYAYRDTYFDVNGDGLRDRIAVTTARAHVGLDVTDPNPNGVMLWASLTNAFNPDYLRDTREISYSSDAAHFLESDLDLDGIAEIVATGGLSINMLGRDFDGYLVQFDTDFLGASLTGGSPGFRTLEASFDADPRPDFVSLRYGSENPFPFVWLNPEPGSASENTENESLSFDAKQMLMDENIEFYAEGSSFAIADINGDGLDDILMRGDDQDPPRGATRTVLPWINAGDGSFTIGTMFLVTESEADPTTLLHAIDHDHDGDMDLVSMAGDNDNEFMEIYVNDGQGVFAYHDKIAFHSYNGLRVYWVTSTDVDLDGYTDIVAVLQDLRDESEVMIVYGSAEGLVSPPAYIAGRGAAEVIFGDINADGLPDMITCAYDTPHTRRHSLSFSHQLSPREFGPVVSISEVELSALLLTDIDHDGTADLLCSQRGEAYNPVFRGIPQICLADLNLDGSLNFFDITLFIQQFIDGRRLVDLNRDGELNFFDVAEMIASYTQGCP